MDKRLVQVCQAGNIEAFYALLDDEPNILNFIDDVPFTRTPLHLAVLARKPYFAREIASLRPSFITKIDRFGYSPIHLAAETGQVEMVRNLLEKLAPTKKELTKGKENRTPLHVAVISGKVEVVKFLVKYYPSCIMDTTTRNETALHLAVKNKQLGAFLVLLEQLKLANQSQRNVPLLLLGAVYGSSFDKSKVTSDLLNCKDDEGNTILHLAIMMKQQQMVEALLNTCTNSAGTLQVDVNTLNGKNFTALDILLQCPLEQRDAKIEENLRSIGAKSYKQH
ncbi:ankyrin repeat-containing protein BDA1-like [Chenopodium quinoa]|uniref:Uncharacterized protein n=1 Tax=Chenopodium quinoa TaxID=63459 RepID=A0A803LUE9_CHEQI|nr:ankyrin repeat-containing protein BDA1-like [Chenopodium quinoa]